MECPNCGADVTLGDVFCGECGFRLPGEGRRLSLPILIGAVIGVLVLGAVCVGGVVLIAWPRGTPTPEGVAQLTPTPREEALLTPAPTNTPVPEPTDTSVPIPTDTPPPTPTPTTPPEPVVTPGEPPAPGWEIHQTEEFEIWLPGTWESFPVEREALEMMVDMWEAINPNLAEYMDFLIQSGMYEQIDFWAMDTEATQFVSNVNILSVPMPVSPALYVNSASSEMERMGATIISTDDSLEIGGHPAGRIEYSMPMEIPGWETVVARGIQYALSVDSSTYVLTFSTSEDQVSDMSSVFEMSANSFRVY